MSRARSGHTSRTNLIDENDGPHGERHVEALRIAHGPYGRVVLLDMDAPLVRHAHPRCHVLIKAGGADTQFLVRGRTAPLTRDSAVLINAWEPHCYAHDAARPRTIILALYLARGRGVDRRIRRTLLAMQHDPSSVGDMAALARQGTTIPLNRTMMARCRSRWR